MLEVLLQIIEGPQEPHSTFVEPLKTLKKGRLLFASFAMNLFLVCEGCIYRIACILSGLASMPLVETR
jgi:hypothetical protein